MTILKKILNAREKRALMRQKIAQNGLITLSLSLNIPGYPKYNTLINRFFQEVLLELQINLTANRIFIEEQYNEIHTDEAGEFFLTAIKPGNLKAHSIKEVTEKFEENHPAGRLIDVDIYKPEGFPVSSGKAKTCILCREQPAIVCMRAKNHTLEEIRRHIEELIKKHLTKKGKEYLTTQLASFAIQSILSEISLSPKPGLVSTSDSGIHADMNYQTFLNSTAAIGPYFKELAKSGVEFKGENYKQILPQVRQIGLKMEAQMFTATGGINTQKGVIFLLGLSLFISGYVINEQGKFDIERFREILLLACADLELELSNKTANLSHGEKCAEKFGYHIGGGARSEAQAGFQTVFNHGLPELRKHTYNKGFAEISLKNTLMALMAEANDSNILFRSDAKTLLQFQKLAQKSIQAKNQEEKDKIYQRLIQFCKEHKVSPGGSADLLTVTIFMELTSNLENKITG